jgi:hypothetical protein
MGGCPLEVRSNIQITTNINILFYSVLFEFLVFLTKSLYIIHIISVSL